MQDSLFTKIIKGEIPCHKIYEDDRTFAFLDIHPQNPGHVLLIPKLQVDSLWELPEAEYLYLWSVAKKIELKIQTTLQPPRVGAIVEGFGVPHAHIHILPLYHGDDIKKIIDLSADPEHTSLSEMANKLAF